MSGMKQRRFLSRGLFWCETIVWQDYWVSCSSDEVVRENGVVRFIFAEEGQLLGRGARTLIPPWIWHSRTPSATVDETNKGRYLAFPRCTGLWNIDIKLMEGIPLLVGDT